MRCSDRDLVRKLNLYKKRPLAIRAKQMVDEFEVETLEGTMRGNAGDYLIFGVAGEMYPCKPDIFTTTYEEVNEDNERIDKAEILARIDVLEIKGKLQTSLEFTEMLCYIMREFTALLSGDAKIIETIPMHKEEEKC